MCTENYNERGKKKKNVKSKWKRELSSIFLLFFYIYFYIDSSGIY